MRLTYAIRFKQTPEEKKRKAPPFYVCFDREHSPATGIAYCCGCKETKQFPSIKLARETLNSLEILEPGKDPQFHEIIDSETAAKEKKQRTKK